MTTHGRRARRWAHVVVPVLSLIALVSCSSKGATTVDPSFTRAQAQDRVVALLGETLGQLPPGLSLTFAEPEPGFGTLGPGLVVPCVDDNTAVDPPKNLQLAYWVSGAPLDQVGGVFRSIGDSFTRRGYDTKPDGAQTVRGYTPDGYALVAQLNSRGGLSLTGSTPCFPAANQATITPEPTVIPHP